MTRRGRQPVHESRRPGVMGGAREQGHIHPHLMQWYREVRERMVEEAGNRQEGLGE